MYVHCTPAGFLQHHTNGAIPYHRFFQPKENRTTRDNPVRKGASAGTPSNPSRNAAVILKQGIGYTLQGFIELMASISIELALKHAIRSRQKAATNTR